MNTDGAWNSQFMPRIAVDQTTGNVALCWYDNRETGSLELVRFFARVSTDHGVSFGLERIVSEGVSDGNPPSVDTSTLGDFTGLDFHDGAFFPVWGDNSGLSGNPDGRTEVFTKREVP